MGDKHQSLYKLTLLFLMEVARHIQSTQSRKLVIFLQYITGVIQENNLNVGRGEPSKPNAS